MRLHTRVTIGKNTEEFLSSRDTLGTNLYATLLIRGAGREVCRRLEQVLSVSKFRQLRFQEGDVSIEVDELPPEKETIQKAIDAVAQLNLQKMAERVQREHPEWNSERTAAALMEYQRFLVMAALFPQEEIMPITDDMDHVWHAHILHTTQYAEDSENLFGEFLHHEPADTPFPPPELRERTCQLYFAAFGTLLPENDGFCSAERSSSKS